jgi:hypothetical protein
MAAGREGEHTVTALAGEVSLLRPSNHYPNSNNNNKKKSRMRVFLIVAALTLSSLAALSVFDNSARLYAYVANVGSDSGDAPVLRGVRARGRKPSKPLCVPCLGTVQRAGRRNVTFLDVSGGRGEHPHLGATYEDGTTFGYVHDETALKRDPPPFRYGPDGDLREACLIRDENHIVLTEKVFVDLNETREIEKSGRPRDKIFCTVFTIEQFHYKIPAIRETWGCVRLLGVLTDRQRARTND